MSEIVVVAVVGVVEEGGKCGRVGQEGPLLLVEGGETGEERCVWWSVWIVGVMERW